VWDRQEILVFAGCFCYQ